MIKEKSVIALIPARGGSKGIKNKNIIDIDGKPLISYTIEAAKKSAYIDKVVVTTDSEKIASVSKKYGAEVPFLRPERIAGDCSKTIDAVLHAMEWFTNHEENYDIFVLLQPTSPLRSCDDIDGALEHFLYCDCRPLVGVSEVQDPPVLIRTIGTDNKLHRLLDVNSTVRRQEMQKYYRVNGSVYICMSTELCEQTSFNDFEEYYIIQKEHAVDIDELADIELVKYYMSEQKDNHEKNSFYYGNKS